jgi:hypothetical protein
MEYDSTKLYVYAFEMGMTPDIERALLAKARGAAKSLPVKYGRIGILLDCSESMFGSEQQKLRPMAVALATRDMLRAASSSAEVRYVGGARKESGIIFPTGYTALGRGLAELLKEDVEAVFVITDGYENSPAGRFDEVVRAARKLGVKTPIFQFNPVSSAEAGSVRQLSKEVSALPINKPESIGMTMIRGMLELDLGRGIEGLLGMTLPLLLASSRHEGPLGDRGQEYGRTDNGTANVHAQDQVQVDAAQEGERVNHEAGLQAGVPQLR